MQALLDRMRLLGAEIGLDESVRVVAGNRVQFATMTVNVEKGRIDATGSARGFADALDWYAELAYRGQQEPEHDGIPELMGWKPGTRAQIAARVARSVKDSLFFPTQELFAAIVAIVRRYSPIQREGSAAFALVMDSSERSKISLRLEVTGDRELVNLSRSALLDIVPRWATNSRVSGIWPAKQGSGFWYEIQWFHGVSDAQWQEDRFKEDE